MKMLSISSGNKIYKTHAMWRRKKNESQKMSAFFSWHPCFSRESSTLSHVHSNNASSISVAFHWIYGILFCLTIRGVYSYKTPFRFSEKGPLYDQSNPILLTLKLVLLWHLFEYYSLLLANCLIINFPCYIANK